VIGHLLAAAAFALSLATGLLLAAAWLPPARPPRDAPVTGRLAHGLIRVGLALPLGMLVSSITTLVWLALVQPIASSPRVVLLLDVVALGLVAMAWALGRSGSARGSAHAPDAAAPGEARDNAAPDDEVRDGVDATSPGPPPPAFALTAAALALAAVAVAAWRVLDWALHARHGDYDAWYIYNLKAKFFVRLPDAWAMPLTELPWWTHPEYPLLLPLNVARLWLVSASEAVGWPMLLSLAQALATLTLLAGAVMLRRGPVLAGAAAILLLGSPHFLSGAWGQVADLPLGLTLLGVFVVLGLILADPAPPIESDRTDADRRRLLGLHLLLGLLIGSAGWIKNEGLAAAVWLALLLGVAGWRMLARDDRLWRAIALVIGAAPPLLVNFAMKFTLAGSSDLVTAPAGDGAFASDQPRHLLAMLFDPARHAMILDAGFHALGYGAPVHDVVTGQREPGSPFFPLLLGALVAGVLLGGLHRSRPDRRLAGLATLFVLGQTAIYYLVYLVTPHDLRWHLTTSAHRLVAHLLPTALLAAMVLIRLPGPGVPTRPRRRNA